MLGLKVYATNTWLILVLIEVRVLLCSVVLEVEIGPHICSVNTIPCDIFILRHCVCL